MTHRMEVSSCAAWQDWWWTCGVTGLLMKTNTTHTLAQSPAGHTEEHTIGGDDVPGALPGHLLH